MRTDEFHVTGLTPVIDRQDEAIFIATDVEHNTPALTKKLTGSFGAQRKSRPAQHLDTY
jgi:hypothetical protein